MSEGLPYHIVSTLSMSNGFPGRHVISSIMIKKMFVKNKLVGLARYTFFLLSKFEAASTIISYVWLEHEMFHAKNEIL